MTDKISLEALIPGLPDVETRPDVDVLRWWEGSVAWSFVVDHADKIRKKLRVTPPADRADLATELRWGLMLAQDPQNTVRYEKYDAEGGRSPDYNVAHPEWNINLEVKSLRPTDLESRLDAWQERMLRRFSGLKPSRYLLASFEMLYLEERDRRRWMETLEADEEELAQVATRAILQTQLAVGECEKISLGHGVSLRLSAFDGAPGVANAGSTIPVMYGQREHLKFGALLMESLSQLRPGETNVLAIDTLNATHERHDLEGAIYELQRCEDSVFTRYGFEGREDFWNQARVLSGVVFRTVWRAPLFERPPNHVWVNPQADAPLPSDLRADLAFLDAPHRPALLRRA